MLCGEAAYFEVSTSKLSWEGMPQTPLEVGVSYMGCVLHGVCSTWGVSYMGCVLHGVCSTWGVFYMGCVLHGVSYGVCPTWGVFGVCPT